MLNRFKDTEKYMDEIYKENSKNKNFYFEYKIQIIVYVKIITTLKESKYKI